MSEDRLQSRVVRYIKETYPDVKYCSSIAGAYISSRVQRAKIVRNGYVRGKNDLDIYEARGGYFALFLELKENAYPTKAQKDWIAAMNERGYYAEITRGYEQTINTIDKYLSMPQTKGK
ncbi:MAG: hypothetical protein H8E84_05260 [Flavobacteriales bacterium]|nr:hypothetical protein [Flavobacteriales bacterium]